MVEVECVVQKHVHSDLDLSPGHNLELHNVVFESVFSQELFGQQKGTLSIHEMQLLFNCN